MTLLPFLLPGETGPPEREENRSRAIAKSKRDDLTRIRVIQEAGFYRSVVQGLGPAVIVPDDLVLVVQ